MPHLQSRRQMPELRSLQCRTVVEDSGRNDTAKKMELAWTNSEIFSFPWSEGFRYLADRSQDVSSRCHLHDVTSRLQGCNPQNVSSRAQLLMPVWIRAYRKWDMFISAWMPSISLSCSRYPSHALDIPPMPSISAPTGLPILHSSHIAVKSWAWRSTKNVFGHGTLQKTFGVMGLYKKRALLSRWKMSSSEIKTMNVFGIQEIKALRRHLVSRLQCNSVLTLDCNR